jgi:propanol-preferring alcohol dehydrogenase
MEGVVLRGNDVVEVVEYAIPEPGPGEARIRVKSAGICGSDLHFYHSAPGRTDIPLDRIVGHEPAGIVDSVGTGTSRVAVGDRVIVNHTLGCGRCRHCLIGETVLCDQNIGMALAGRGGDAEYVVMPERNCYPIPEELSFADGSFLSCTGATAFGAVEKAQIRGGSCVAVYGLGPVGLSCVVVARAMGAFVCAIDPNPARLSFARELGADLCLDPTTTKPIDALRDRFGRGADAAIETSGAAAAQADAVRAIRKRGTAVYVGLSSGDPTISPELFLHDQKTLRGSKVLPTSDYPKLIDLMMDTGLRFEPLVTHRYALRDAQEAFRRFSAGGPGKFVFEVE